MAGLFIPGFRKQPSLNLGGKLHDIKFCKGGKKTLCKFNFRGKLHDFKEFFFAEAAL
jgi:hypothetical protein